MDHLSSCYFCGTALDEPLGTYVVTESDAGTTVTLCPSCQRKLDTILDVANAPGIEPAENRVAVRGAETRASIGDGSRSAADDVPSRSVGKSPGEASEDEPEKSTGTAAEERGDESLDEKEDTDAQFEEEPLADESDGETTAPAESPAEEAPTDEHTKPPEVDEDTPSPAGEELTDVTAEDISSGQEDSAGSLGESPVEDAEAAGVPDEEDPTVAPEPGDVSSPAGTEGSDGTQRGEPEDDLAESDDTPVDDEPVEERSLESLREEMEPDLPEEFDAEDDATPADEETSQTEPPAEESSAEDVISDASIDEDRPDEETAADAGDIDPSILQADEIATGKVDVEEVFGGEVPEAVAEAMADRGREQSPTADRTDPEASDETDEMDDPAVTEDDPLETEPAGDVGVDDASPDAGSEPSGEVAESETSAAAEESSDHVDLREEIEGLDDEIEPIDDSGTEDSGSEPVEAEDDLPGTEQGADAADDLDELAEDVTEVASDEFTAPDDGPSESGRGDAGGLQDDADVLDESTTGDDAWEGQDENTTADGDGDELLDESTPVDGNGDVMPEKSARDDRDAEEVPHETASHDSVEGIGSEDDNGFDFDRGTSAGTDAEDDLRAEMEPDVPDEFTTSATGNEDASEDAAFDEDVTRDENTGTVEEPTDVGHDESSGGEPAVETGDTGPGNGGESEESAEATDQTRAEPGEDGETEDSAGDEETPRARTSISALEYNKVMRLLQNREFPVERAEIETVASNAYELTEADCAAVIDLAIDRGLLAEDGDVLVRPD